MKRALTGIAAAAVVLGTAAPMAFAATSSGLTKAGQLPIVVNGSVLSNPYEMTGKDSGNTTAYFPVYYFDQALTKIGYTATWDGVTHTWAITAPGVDASTVASSIAGGVGTGNTTITVNGTVVKKINTKAAKDPAASKSAAATTYFPAYYIDEIFNSLGANVSFSGQTGLKITGNVASTGATLSDLSFSGETMGSGSSTSPAVESGTGKVAVSTTLTDASGNPVSGIDVTYTVTGNANSAAPTATSGSSEVSANPAEADYTWTYSVTTNAAGVASINFSNPSNGSYSIVASAPFQVNGSDVTSNTGYLEFGQPGSVVISPISATETFSSSSNATAGLVPVTVTVIPSISGSSVSNIPVAFTLTNTSGSSEDANPYIATSAGAQYSSGATPTVDGTDGTPATTTAYTNASGQATIYVNANGSTSATVSATANAAGITNSTATTGTLTWEPAGTATQISGFSGSNQTVNENTNVTFSGQVQDALGNPVANAQILVSANDNGNDDVSYVNGSTTTAFPNVGTNIVGVVASSSFGDLVTTDANGNFQVTVTDSTSETPTFQFWAVNNGYVSGSGSDLNGALETVGKDYSPVTWGNNSTALSDVYIDTNASKLGSDADTSISGSYQDGNAGTVYVAGYEGNGNAYAPANATVQYNITSNNSGSIASVDGVPLDGSGNLPNGPSGAVVDVTYNSDGTAVKSVTVDGAPISPDASVLTDGAAFSFVPNSTKVENDTFTVTTGAYSATLNASFSAGTPGEYAVSTGNSGISPAGSENLTFTVEDANGNPIPYGSFKLNLDQTNKIDSGLWIQAVNGQTLTSNVTQDSVNYGSQLTPIPLFAFNDTADHMSTVSSVFASGAVEATGVGTANPSITLTADQTGKVTLTLYAGGIGYWNASAIDANGNPAPGVQGAPDATSSSSMAYFGYNTASAGSPSNLTFSNSPDTANEFGSIQY